MVGTEKLKKLWNVHPAQSKTVADTIQRCENAAIETKLKLCYDFALKQRSKVNWP